MKELLGPQGAVQPSQRRLIEEAHSPFDHLVELLRSHRPAATAPTQGIDQRRAPNRDAAPAALSTAAAPWREMEFGAAQHDAMGEPPLGKLRRKRKLHAGDQGNAAKRRRQRLLQLPVDVVVRVLMHASAKDVANARLTCRLWRNAVDGHVLELWQGRCEALGLLPPEGTDTGLGAASDLFRLLVDKICREAPAQDVRRELTRAYRRHYAEWAPTCEVCSLACKADVKACCAYPGALTWNVTRERWLVAHFCRRALAIFTRLSGDFPFMRKVLVQRVDQLWAKWVDGAIAKTAFLVAVDHFVYNKFPNVKVVEEFEAWCVAQENALR